MPRSEFRSIISAFGFAAGEPLPGQDDAWDLAVFLLFDRLRAEFPDEIWEPAKNWSSATVDRRRQLGLVGRPRFATGWGSHP